MYAFSMSKNSTAVFCKPAKHGSVVPWHQDSALWGLKPDAWTAETAPVLFDWWMALDPATRENGCLQLLPGSHKKGIVPHARSGGIMQEADPRQFGFDPADAVYVEAQPGDMVVWHQDMFHYSGPNRSDRPRLAAVGTYVAARDLPLMRRLRPDAKLLDKVPVALDGRAVELPEYVPAVAD
jgi:ectoine hydroxylase-related dioxygenase (phytanoyl-CoA dioxygenase family)